MTLEFRVADARDAASIAALTNSGYRGEQSKAGWTTEADLLDGIRTDEQEVAGIIADPASVFLLCERDGELAGSVHLQRVDDRTAYLGMLVVRPGLQGGGIGKRFLAAAEDLVRERWNSARMTMTVITVRSELIAFYERRGYARTGRRRPFPDVAKSTSKVGPLEFEELEKTL